MSECSGGFLGKLLGHKFRGRYSTTYTAPTSDIKASGVNALKLVEVFASRTSAYECDVCERCGLKLHKGDASQNQCSF